MVQSERDIRELNNGNVRTERISTLFLSMFSSVSVESRKTICALTMVWMLGLAVPSMAGVRALVEASVMRRPPWPPPEAVLEDLRGDEVEIWNKTDRSRLEQRAEIPYRTPSVCEHASRIFELRLNLGGNTHASASSVPPSPNRVPEAMPPSAICILLDNCNANVF